MIGNVPNGVDYRKSGNLIVNDPSGESHSSTGKPVVFCPSGSINNFILKQLSFLIWRAKNSMGWLLIILE
jgi:hypothetical protein